MKQMLACVILTGALIGCSFFCRAQPYHNSGGARWAGASGFTFRQMQTEKHAIEALLTFRWGGPIVTGMYERYYHIGETDLIWYFGGGPHLGYNRRSEDNADENKLFINVGIDVIAGIEYIFPTIPFNVSLDFKPSLSLTATNGATGEVFGLSVRYVW